MIKNIHIKGFKCFADEVVYLSNLTVITGPNSSGKSSLIQAMLMNLNHTNLSDSELTLYLNTLGNFADLKNKILNPDKFEINIELEDTRILKYENIMHQIKFNNILDLSTTGYKNNIYSWYLSSNRKILSEDYTGSLSADISYCGIEAQDLGQYYYAHKGFEVLEDVRNPLATDNTLEAQVNYWLSYICDTELSLNIDKISSTFYRAYYKINNQEYKPQNIGAGVSYLVAILTKSLLMHNKLFQEIFIIENPEMHLHPKSQARLAEFFAFVAKTGRQIVIETHSEHLISKLRYCVYNKQIAPSQALIQYRQAEKFEKIEILANGKLLNSMGEHSFPRGFFDATLDNIFEINSNV